MEYRRASSDDAEALARLFADGLATYRSFAPDGWNPPGPEREQAELEGVLGNPRIWCQIAVDEGELVGQVMILPAELSRVPPDEPGIAHLRNLFVAESRWGTGLARTLHGMAVEEARERGFTHMRLYAAAGHRRARRFYEREGWIAFAERLDEDVGLSLLEYRLEL